MGRVDPDDPRQPFQQVADDLRTAITEARYQLGQQLPRQQEIAEDYGVSLGTVKSALAQLRKEGLIVARRGEPARVRFTPGKPERTPAETDEQADIRDMLGEVLRRLDVIESRLPARKD
jgi:DNA-binding GntR family transcriptional regulator